MTNEKQVFEGGEEVVVFPPPSAAAAYSLAP